MSKMNFLRSNLLALQRFQLYDQSVKLLCLGTEYGIARRIKKKKQKYTGCLSQVKL